MPNQLTIAIEGADADRALAEFLAIPGVDGSTVSNGDGEAERGALVVVGVVLAVAANVAQVVSSMLDWRDRWKRGRETKHLSVVIEDATGNRIALDHATPEQVTAALQSLAR